MKPADSPQVRKRQYLKEKINELATNSKNKNIRDMYRGINECKSSYQPRNNLVEDENGDLLADSHKILTFSQSLKVYNFIDVTQIEIHTVEPLVSSPGHLEVETAIAKLEKCKSPNNDHILTKLIQAGSGTLKSVTYKRINSIWNMNCLISGRSLLLYHFTRRVIKLAVISIVGYHVYQVIQYSIKFPSLKVKAKLTLRLLFRKRTIPTE
jgi:hypothetical protein